MAAMDRHTGRAINADAHLAQSIVDILTTPKRTLVQLRDYGSELPLVLGRPINGETLIDVFQAVAEALDIWEPRLDLARVRVADVSPGSIAIELIDGEGNVLELPSFERAGDEVLS